MLKSSQISELNGRQRELNSCDAWQFIHAEHRINDKLAAYGLEDELSLMEVHMHLKTLELKWLKEPTKLTERRWDSIKDTVVSYMQAARAQRLATARAKRLNQPFRKILKVYDHAIQAGMIQGRPVNQLPGFADMCVMPVTLELLDFVLRMDGLGRKEPIDKEPFLQFLNQLPEALDTWLAACKNTLLAVMPPVVSSSPPFASTAVSLALLTYPKTVEVTSAQSSRAIPPGSCSAPSSSTLATSESVTCREGAVCDTDRACQRDSSDSPSAGENTAHPSPKEDRLVLATTWFRCSVALMGHGCEAIDFPRVLGHRCFVVDRTAKIDTESEDLSDTLLNVAKVYGQAVRWNLGASHVEWDAASAASAADIVRACGRDPETATAAEMDELDARLACVACSERSFFDPRNSETFSWVYVMPQEEDVGAEWFNHKHDVVPVYNWRRAVRR